MGASEIQEPGAGFPARDGRLRP